jgi:cytochrome c556
MRHFTNLLGLTAASLFFVAGCSQAPEPAGGNAAGSADDVESAEFLAVEYRQGLMHVMAFKADPVRNMADGSAPVDEALFLDYAEDLAAAAGMIVEGFIPGSSAQDISISSGLPDIWDNWDDFLEKRKVDLQQRRKRPAISARTAAAATDPTGNVSGRFTGCACRESAQTS